MNATNEEQDAVVKAIAVFGDNVAGLKQKQFRFTVKVSIAFGLVLLALLCLVCVIMFVLFPKIDHNTRKVKSVQCSLYRLVLTSGYHPESRIDPTKEVEEQRENLRIYNFQYKTIVTDNNRLGCVKAPEPTKYVTEPKEATTTTLPTHATQATFAA